jgi:hypothetical protein
MSEFQRVLQLLRSLFPYWKFFDRLGVVPRAYYRYGEDGNATDWQPLHPPQNRQWGHLFHNPKINKVLWEQSQLSLFLDECQQLKKNQILNHELYRWLQERVCEKIKDRKWSWYQFRVCLLSYEERKLKVDLWIESENHKKDHV